LDLERGSDQCDGVLGTGQPRLDEHILPVIRPQAGRKNPQLLWRTAAAPGADALGRSFVSWLSKSRKPGGRNESRSRSRRNRNRIKIRSKMRIKSKRKSRSRIVR